MPTSEKNARKTRMFSHQKKTVHNGIATMVFDMLETRNHSFQSQIHCAWQIKNKIHECSPASVNYEQNTRVYAESCIGIHKLRFFKRKVTFSKRDS